MIARSDDVTAADFYAEGGGDDLIDRVVQQFSLTGSSPTPDGEYWGNVQTTATDLGSMISQILADPTLSAVIGPAMKATSAYAEDGVDQRFGMRAVPGAGSKQGWGCCLSGVTGVHSVGYTDDRIVVVLSGAEPDDYSLGSQDGLALQADPGGQASIAALTATVRAALGGPPVDWKGCDDISVMSSRWTNLTPAPARRANHARCSGIRRDRPATGSTRPGVVQQ